MLGLVAMAEIGLRAVAGLGGMSLVIADPAMGYIPRPGSVHHRLGNRISFNAASQRARPVPAPDDPALRVLVIGDSVVHGGFLDDRDLATARAEAILSRAVGEAWVGNVSAGGWGPGQHHAYLERFGAFGAQVAVVVVNAADLMAPRRRGLGLLPVDRPVLAIEEAMTRLVAPRMRAWAARYLPEDGAPGVDAGALSDLGAVLDLLAAAGARVGVLFHPARAGGREGEAGGPDHRALQAVTQLAAGRRIVTTDLAAAYAAQGGALYSDAIHLGAAGQAVLGEVIAAVALDLARTGGAQP